MTNLHSLPAPKPRISSKLREAINFRIRKGLIISDACEKAGVSTAGWYKAMKRPTVLEYYTEVQTQFVREAEQLQAVAKARAIEVAIDLMENAKSETIRARMAEFLLSEGKVPQVAVHVDARQTGHGDYAFVRPGQKVVELKAEDSSE